ncbi:two-component response regulator [Pseudomonas aeruginosa]|nr:two-component response regulator [Pseudomonas aeruginosa]AOX30374.1 two-component response regulator [Pseudomonas aeruginosa]AOX36800.1 two-component response regulator [Pseudomonas aeruginosa]APB54462.1 two-component response regulator [Pseudomonas aeruginosa]OGX64975.1 putative two-component response regulator [Pseudomonas aeruginosa]
MSKVLIVDDHPAIRLAVRLLFERDGFTIVGEADNGAEALQVARKKSPDLAILDIGIPKIDGLEVIARPPEVPEAGHQGPGPDPAESGAVRPALPAGRRHGLRQQKGKPLRAAARRQGRAGRLHPLPHRGVAQHQPAEPRQRGPHAGKPFRPRDDRAAVPGQRQYQQGHRPAAVPQRENREHLQVTHHAETQRPFPGRPDRFRPPPRADLRIPCERST